MSDELKKIGDRMVSAILVTNPAPHVLWGKDELKVYFDCEDRKLDSLIKEADFPQPIVNESQRIKRWNPQAVISWYKNRIIKAGRPRAA